MTEIVRVKKADIDAASTRLEAMAGNLEVAKIWRGRIVPGLITCIDYRSTTHPDKHHQTRYYTMMGEGDFSGIRAPIPPVGVLNVRLWRIFYGQYAD